MHRFRLLLFTLWVVVLVCSCHDIDPAILEPEVAANESLRPITVSSKIVDNQLQVTIQPQGPFVCCCAPCLQPTYNKTDKYQIQIALTENGPYQSYTTIKIGEQETEQLKLRSITFPSVLTNQPLVVRVVSVDKDGKPGYVRAIMNSTSPIPTSITEVAVNEKDELLSLSFNPARPQVAYTTYVQDASYNVIYTLRLADYSQGQLTNIRVITPGGVGGTFSRDGKQLVYFLPRQTNDSPSSLVIRDMVTGTNRIIELPVELWLGSPTWSPDGQQIAFLDQHNEYTRLWLLQVNDGRLTPVTPTMPAKDPGGIRQGTIDWSPDGKVIAATRSRRVTNVDWRYGVSLISPTTGDFLSDDNTLAGWLDVNPSFSPDGQRVAFVSSRADGSWRQYTLWIRNLATKQLQHVRLPDALGLSDDTTPKWVNGNALLIKAYAGTPIKNKYFVVAL